MITKCRACGGAITPDTQVCQHCGLERPQVWNAGTKPRAKRSPLAKFLLTILTAILVVMFALPIVFYDPDQPSTREQASTAVIEQEKPTPEPAAAKSNEERAREEAVRYVDQVRRELESIKKFDGSSYRESTDAIVMEAVLFSAWAKTLQNKFRHKLTSEELDIVNQFEAEIKRVQRQELPRMRDAYGPAARKALWEHDIEVKTFGDGFRTIEFVGGLFITNRNKQEFQTKVSDVLKMLRFTQARYKWYKGDDEYTYYTMTVLGDDVIQP